MTRPVVAPVSGFFALALAGGLAFVAPAARACTVFVLTDETRTLFFNNEDFSNPSTRLWFVPAGTDFLGCAYVGFDDGWAQGGVNTAGLAFDWVAGTQEKWEPGPGQQRVRGNPAERMLETCTSVDEAVAFFRTHREPGFARGRMLVADRRGRSAILGAKDGELTIELATVSRGFGYGWRALAQRLSPAPEPTVAHGLEILRACTQAGRDPTQYSNAFDLRTGALVLAPAPFGGEPVEFSLNAELAKGGHVYDLPKIREQLPLPPRELPPGLTRFYLDRFTPIPDREPLVTARIRRALREAARGAMQADDYSAELWREIAPSRQEMRAALRQLGELGNLTLVEHTEENGGRSYRYIVEFSTSRVLQRYVLAKDGRIAAVRSEFVERSALPSALRD